MRRIKFKHVSAWAAIVLLFGAAGCKTKNINSEPDGAAVTAKGERFGLTPTKVSVGMFSEKDLTVAKSDYISQQFRVSYNSDESILVRLVPDYYTIFIDSDPQGADVKLGDEILGLTPLTLKNKLFKPAALTVSKAGFESQTIKVGRDTKKDWKVVLKVAQPSGEAQTPGRQDTPPPVFDPHREVRDLVAGDIASKRFTTAREKLIAYALKDTGSSELNKLRRKAAFEYIQEVNAMAYEALKERMSSLIDKHVEQGDYNTARNELMTNKVWTTEILPNGLVSILKDMTTLASESGIENAKAMPVMEKFYAGLRSLFNDDTVRDNAGDQVKYYRDCYNVLVEDLASGLAKYDDDNWKIGQDKRNKFIRLIHNGFDPLINSLSEEKVRESGKTKIIALGMASFRRKVQELRASLIAKVEKAEAEWLEQVKARDMELEKFRNDLDVAHYLARVEDAIKKERGDDICAVMLGEYARVLRTLRLNNLKFVNEGDSTTVLSMAGYLGHVQLVDFALKFGAKVDGISAKDPLRRTPLMWAVKGGNCEQVDRLIASGADVKIKDATGSTALITAAYHGDTRCMAVLIKAQSDLSAANGVGDTPFLAAVRGLRNCHGQIRALEMLKLSGADMTVADAHGDYALAIAAQRDNLEVVQWLLALKDKDGKAVYSNETKNKALEYAVNNSSTEMAVCLIAAQAECTSAMLNVAVSKGNLNLVRLIVEQGVDVQTVTLVGSKCVNEIAEYLYSQGYWASRPSEKSEMIKAMMR